MASPSTTTPPAAPAPEDRAALRKRLLAERKAWAGSPAAVTAQDELQQRVQNVLAQLEPECLGIFWPVQGEFNPMDAAMAARRQWRCRLALPFARRSPVGMHFVPWDGSEPSAKDECGIPTGAGEPVVPDVVLVPCVGFASQGWRLGYGGGYFDRFLAAHPFVTAIGVCWDFAHLDESVINPQPHDRRLMAVITESNIWSE